MSPWTCVALAAAGTFALSTVLTGLVHRYAVRHRLLDTVNERSSHVVPTPRGGGLAIVLSTLAGTVAGWLGTLIETPVALTILGGGTLVAVLGWIDDHGHVPSGWRLAAHLAAATWAVWWIGPLELGWALVPEPASSIMQWPASILMVAWMLNLFNFMDGIDGIAASEGVLVGAFGFAIVAMVDRSLSTTAGFPFAVLAAAAAGFLMWNWPPAKIFMGDVGSGFAGFVIGTLFLVANKVAPAVGAAVILLAGVFIVDATVTLLIRLSRRERIYEAHRSHGYQRLARRWRAHRPVTLATIVSTTFLLAPLSWLIAAGHIHPLAGLAAGMGPLAALAIYLGAGHPDD